jgi:CubicO group peptidase (beta-lactamase class C family)
MPALDTDLRSVVSESGFSGVVRIDRAGRTELVDAYGHANRALAIPNAADTVFGIASGTKGLTALVVMGLIEDGLLDLSTTARSVLGSDLPLIDERVTVEHLLAHRSGIGDYVDEETDVDVDGYLLPVPVQELAATEQYVVVLDGHPTKFAPDERFAYSNSGYVVLALLAERVTRTPFHELVRVRVTEPAGMTDTAFLRSDELPGRAAVGYVGDGLRSNVLHLPVRGNGDGGIYTTVEDVDAFWRALFAGAIVSPESLAEMLRRRSTTSSGSRCYGLGFWLDPSTDAVVLNGRDAGVSFYSEHDPPRRLTFTIVSNTTDGAWPVVRHLRDRFQQ